MIEPVDSTFHIWATFALVALAILLFSMERLLVEISALIVLVALLLLFELAPFPAPRGAEALGTMQLLSGFANPALFAVLALLVVGQGLIRTGGLDWLVRFVLRCTGSSATGTLALSFAAVMLTSAFVNNTPVVVMFIPILEAVSRQFGRSPSRVMMPLSFAAILAGMTTLIGSSTNLLVSGTLAQLGHDPLGFFSFSVPGIALAAIGVAYLIFIAPKLQRDRESPMERITAGPHRRFVAQLLVEESSRLVGEDVRSNLLDIPGSRLILLQRGEHAYTPPYGNLKVWPGDVLVVLATSEALAKAQTTYPHLHFTTGDEDIPPGEEKQAGELQDDQLLAEIMVAPGSRFVGNTLEEVGFRSNFGCLVLGVERRAHVIRRRLTGLRLSPGDVLVIQGSEDALERVRRHRGFVMMDGSTVELPAPHRARLAGAIFIGVVATAATGLLPIAAAAVTGAALMTISGILTLRQAAQAVDRRIYLLVGTALALSAALTETGGAVYLAHGVVGALEGAGIPILLSALFLMVALLTNVLTNNATAVLFTPIAVGLAQGLGVDPMPFAIAVLLAANCSFATPVGYQTNLLVMGPGYYRFRDFMIVGGPLVIVLWIAFSLFAPWYYGL